MAAAAADGRITSRRRRRRPPPSPPLLLLLLLCTCIPFLTVNAFRPAHLPVRRLLPHSFTLRSRTPISITRLHLGPDQPPTNPPLTTSSTTSPPSLSTLTRLVRRLEKADIGLIPTTAFLAQAALIGKAHVRPPTHPPLQSLKLP